MRAPQAIRELFTERIAEQVAGEQVPIKAIYRRATFHAQLESAQDRKGLTDYEAAIALYESLPQERRESLHQLFKPYVKSLYGAARSALELGLADRAKLWAARCLRVDKPDQMEPVFKYYLAAKACALAGEHSRAERGFRLALQAKGRPDRAFVHHELAKRFAARGDHAAAVDWIEVHVPASRRPPFIWVSTGDWHKAQGHIDAAMRAWESALFRDRDFRHLTLSRLGKAHLERNEPRKARQRFEEALRLRKKRDQATDCRALRGLAAVARLEGATAEADRMEREAESLDR